MDIVRRKPEKGSPWTREEMILVLNLYMKIPYGKMYKSYPAVKELAELMGRSPSTVAIRLSNFASCDPILRERNIKGMADGRKRCQPFWDEFFQNKDALIYESERILAELQGMTIESKYENELKDIPAHLKGETRIREVKTRVNQNVFRKIVLANYDGKCALTGIDIPELLVASHIIPWADNEQERLNPENGICLSSLYDKSFDIGLISFDDNLRVIFSHRLKQNVGKEYYDKYFIPIQGKDLELPQKYLPQPKFLEWHRDSIFEK